jgi:transposase-like protein
MTKTNMDLTELLQKHDQGDLLRSIAEAVLQLMMESDVDGLIGAGRHERAEQRTTWRNGYRDRSLDTRLGTLNLKVPKLRQGSYFPGFLEARKTSEQALVAVIQEAWIGGVSTRRVDELVQAGLQEFVHIVGHAVEFLRADDEVDVGRGFEEGFAARLRHAAEVAEHEVRAFFAELAEHAHFADRFLLRHVADAAGVEQDDIGVRFVGDHAVAAFGEHFRNLFGIALVHLAAVGLDVNAGHFWCR